MMLSFLIYDLISNQLSAARHNIPYLFQMLREKSYLYRTRHSWLEPWVANLNLEDTVYRLSTQLVRGFKIGASALAGFILVFVIALYTAVTPSYYFEGFLSLLPSNQRSRTREVLLAVGSNLRRWFGAQLIAIVTVGTMVALGLWLVGLEYWLLFGLISGLLDIVPWVFTVLRTLYLLVYVPWINESSGHDFIHLDSNCKIKKSKSEKHIFLRKFKFPYRSNPNNTEYSNTKANN